MELKGKVVFSSDKAGDYDIWVLNLDSKKLTQLTSGNFWNDAPKWSPDGRYLIYTSSRPGSGAKRLVVMDLESSKIDRLDFDRRLIEGEVGAHPHPLAYIFCILPERIIRMTYPDEYFGTERYPDWI